MNHSSLPPGDRITLLKLARQSIQTAVNGCSLLPLESEALSEPLRQPGASFVTITKDGRLRGCIGTLEAYQPLAEDVREHAVSAALDDWRFPPVRPLEVACLHIEISRLTPPERLEYGCGDSLLGCLQPGLDGVVLRRGVQRATFLPQVWEQLPNPTDFLGALCQKMGVRADAWQREHLEVFTYRVESFEEDPAMQVVETDYQA